MEAANLPCSPELSWRRSTLWVVVEVVGDDKHAGVETSATERCVPRLAVQVAGCEHEGFVRGESLRLVDRHGVAVIEVAGFEVAGRHEAVRTVGQATPRSPFNKASTRWFLRHTTRSPVRNSRSPAMSASGPSHRPSSISRRARRLRSATSSRRRARITTSRRKRSWVDQCEISCCLALSAVSPMWMRPWAW